MPDYVYILSHVAIVASAVLSILAFILVRKNKKLIKEIVVLKKERESGSQQLNATEFEHTKFILNQHLFKNTLNSIQGYAFRTNTALEKLGGVLDYVLYDSGSQLITLKQELEFAKNFIELNKIKLLPVYDIRIKEDIDENSRFYEEPVILPLITAYFVENAF
jgi:sensor histidine kinase YesM